MARPQIHLEEQRDFTGGLNLEVTPYNLDRNETFDLMNVDLARSGGFGLRRGVKRFISLPPGLQGGEPDSGTTYVDSGAVRHQLVARGGEVRRWDGAAWQNVRSAFGGTGRTRFQEMNNTLYLGTVGTVPHKWTGSGTSTALTTALGNFNDDLENPNAGNFPQCNTFAVHQDVMWAGGTVEAAGTMTCRLRWSHPANVAGGHPEDWHSKHFIDLDPDDENGEITALVPFGDRLIVFKRKAIYAIHGYPPEGVSKNAITLKLGTPSQWSVVATEGTIYFWDIDTGAWSYDGKSLEWIGRRIYPIIDDRKMNVAFSFQVIAEYHRDRVWFSVPWTEEPFENTFMALIFAPHTGKKGAWTIHDKTLFGWWVNRDSDGGDTHLIGGKDYYLQELDVEGFYEDQFHGLGVSLDAAGERVSTPDAAAHDITTDLELEFGAYRDDWLNTLGLAEIMAAKWAAVDGSRSHMWSLLDGGFVELRWTTDGTIATQEIAVSTAPISMSGLGLGGFLNLKATIDVDNGAGQHEVKFWERTSTRASWKQIGATTTADPGTTNVFNGAAELTIGSAAAGATIFGGYNTFRGHVTRFTLRDGIDGTEKANPTFARNPITTSFADAAGLTWTLSANTSIFGLDGIYQRPTAWYTTRWFDAGSAAYDKRWLRPVLVVNGESSQTTHVEVLVDYDSTRVKRTFQVNTSVTAPELVWDAGNWDEAVWAEGLGERSVVLRGSILGGGVARALRFKPIATGAPWSMHGLTMKWKPRRVKG